MTTRHTRVVYTPRGCQIGYAEHSLHRVETPRATTTEGYTMGKQTEEEEVQTWWTGEEAEEEEEVAPAVNRFTNGAVF